MIKNYCGSGTNYICLPDESEFVSYTLGISNSQFYIYGPKYQIESDSPLAPLLDYNFPFVVCHVPTEYHI